MRGLSFVYLSEAWPSLRPVVHTVDVSVDAHPAFIKGRTGVAAVLHGTTERELRDHNPSLYNALTVALARYSGKFIQTPVPAS